MLEVDDEGNSATWGDHVTEPNTTLRTCPSRGAIALVRSTLVVVMGR
jgi:hypothetical protein